MNPNNDFLWQNLFEVPYFRALLRAVEARFYQDFEIQSPVLDMGCGDGQFAQATFSKLLDIGIDPWSGPVRQAAKRGSYRLSIQGSGASLPFPPQSFTTVISNSVLEHIPDVDQVVTEISRVMRPGGSLLFCVPNDQFLDTLSVSTAFFRMGFKRLANAYRRFFNRISRHHHCDSPETWKRRLETNGLGLEQSWNYFSPRAFHVLEWGHYFGLPSWVIHIVFGKWILFPKKWNLWITRKFIERYYSEDPRRADGVYTFYVATKV
jgi:SAM-dependent methyltransferase